MNDVAKELELYLFTIQSFNKDIAQDGQALHVYIVELTNMLARCNYLMAFHKKAFRESKKNAYAKLAASSQSQQKYYSPTLAKDYIDSCCSNTGYVYDLAERTSRTIVHTIDAIRTVISSLKSERQFSNYQM
jgi:hypothetical protein